MQASREFAWVDPSASYLDDPPPRLLILEPDGDVWGLYAFDPTGELLGDTEHRTRARAIRAARDFFGIALDAWVIDHDNDGDDLRRAAERLITKV